MDLARAIQVYVAQGLIGVFFLYFAWKILSRDRKRINVIFSLFYISFAAGIFINFIYAPLTDENLVLYLNFLTNFFLFLGPIFLLVFNLILLKSEHVITKAKQNIIIIVYAAILFCMIFIPGGVTINASTRWKPVWSWSFFIYVAFVISLAVIPTLYCSLVIYRRFGDELLKKKWKVFVLGILIFYAIMYGTCLSNTLNNQSFRAIFSLVSLITTVFSPIMIYYGVGKQVRS